jgi:hypothetical protein
MKHTDVSCRQELRLISKGKVGKARNSAEHRGTPRNTGLIAELLGPTVLQMEKLPKGVINFNSLLGALTQLMVLDELPDISIAVVQGICGFLLGQGRLFFQPRSIAKLFAVLI